MESIASRSLLGSIGSRYGGSFTVQSLWQRYKWFDTLPCLYVRELAASSIDLHVDIRLNRPLSLASGLTH